MPRMAITNLVTRTQGAAAMDAGMTSFVIRFGQVETCVGACVRVDGEVGQCAILARRPEAWPRPDRWRSFV